MKLLSSIRSCFSNLDGCSEEQAGERSSLQGGGGGKGRKRGGEKGEGGEEKGEEQEVALTCRRAGLLMQWHNPATLMFTLISTVYVCN